MKLKILFIAFILSLPFWWGMNILAENLESFVLEQELLKNPRILTAQLNQKIFEEEIKKIKLIKEKRELLAALDINARSAISVEVDNQGNEIVLFEKNSEEPLAIASLSKLMTALVVFDLNGTYDLSQLITIDKEAILQEGQSKYGDLRIGEELSVETLLNIMLIESNNDAAFVLGEPMGQKAFIDLMNIYAQNLGLNSTSFVDSTGLGKNISTVRNLVKLARYILENHPQIFEITRKQSYEVLKPDGSLHHFIPLNTNELLEEFSSIIIGGKTGETPNTGQCLLLITKTPESKGYIINIILNTKDRVGEMKKLISSTKDY